MQYGTSFHYITLHRATIWWDSSGLGNAPGFARPPRFAHPSKLLYLAGCLGLHTSADKLRGSRTDLAYQSCFDQAGAEDNMAIFTLPAARRWRPQIEYHKADQEIRLAMQLLFICPTMPSMPPFPSWQGCALHQHQKLMAL